MQCTVFSFARLLVPYLKAYYDWPLSINRDMINRVYFKQLCDRRD